ncbi:hypothetical protein FHS59_000782 [Algoriphagus iocasae]|uniref:6-bladed beta-propeller n=1 Tax=Algoriphagus iocasae TaxID=1836499 RepID=A0A841MI99_9BACT|nr:6-bladed beta-propeller [Algoriphagus iocasae]MBB6325167.1 hypothetical protein [Algoriphagus iocasae]
MFHFKNTFYALSLSAFLAFGCQNSESNIQEIPTFEITGKSVNDFDKVVESVEFIPLLNNSDSPANLNCSIWNLFITNEYIVYATICNPTAKIHLFDLKGNYLKTFDRAGEGPTEYQNIQGINFTEDTLSLSVGAGLIKHYSFPDFDFIGSETILEELAFLPTFQEIIPNKWLVSPMFDGKTDEEGKYKVFKIVDLENDQFIDIPLKASPLAAEISEGEIAKLGQSYLLNFAFSDTLTILEKTATKPFGVLDFGERGISKQELNRNPEDFEKTVVQQPYAFNMGKIWYTDSIARIKTFALIKNQDMDLSDMRTFPIHEVFLNFSNQKVTAFPSFAGWSNGKGFAKDGYFYDVLRTEDWIHALETGAFGKYGDQLKDQLSKTIGFEDPIVIKYKLKF